MRYTWRQDKNRTNAKKHGIAFRDAVRIFDGITVERVDDRFDYDEVRVCAIGVVNGFEVTVIYTDESDETRHIIAAWFSEPYEKRYFWQNIEV